MKPNFFIKYSGVNNQDTSDIDLVTLGESIIGFDYAIKEIFEISKIEGEIKVRISGTREGSIIVDAINIVSQLKDLPFEKTEHLLSFLQVADTNLYLEAKSFFNQSVNVISISHKTINEYFAKNPFDQQVLTFLFSNFVMYMLGKAQGQKKYANPQELPKEYANALHKMIKDGKFKKIVKPLVEEKVKSIDISFDKNFKQKTSITSTNFEEYLSEEEKILPQYLDGMTYTFTGKIVQMQCSVGDSFKIRIHGFKISERDLIAYPPEGKTTKELENFYEEDVRIIAVVKRDSFYQKPKLFIQEINRYQDPMF